jgi:hypothetical protein
VTPSPSSPVHYVRRGLLKVDDATVLAAVDSLDLRGNAKISAVVGMPLRSLQQRRDVTAFAIGAPVAAVKSLLELLAMEPLEKVVTHSVITPTRPRMSNSPPPLTNSSPTA